MSLGGGEYCYSLDSTYCTVIPERRLIRHVTDRLSGVLHLLMIDWYYRVSDRSNDRVCMYILPIFLRMQGGMRLLSASCHLDDPRSSFYVYKEKKKCFKQHLLCLCIVVSSFKYSSSISWLICFFPFFFVLVMSFFSLYFSPCIFLQRGCWTKWSSTVGGNHYVNKFPFQLTSGSQKLLTVVVHRERSS